MKLYYWNAQENFGDGIAPLILEHFSGGPVTWSPAAESDVIVTGSILHHMPEDWQGTVLGAGTMYADSKTPFQAEYQAVRGPLTAAIAGVQDVALGDPGLIANELVGAQPRTCELGIVPHWSDTTLVKRFKGVGRFDINPADDPLLVIRQIASCKRIVASSLHGIILADAFGIPRRIEMTPRFAQEGGDHKFRDHCAAVGVPFQVGEWQSPLFSRVEDRQHELYDAFHAYGNYIRRQAWAAAATESAF